MGPDAKLALSTNPGDIPNAIDWEVLIPIPPAPPPPKPDCNV